MGTVENNKEDNKEKLKENIIIGKIKIKKSK